MHWGLECTTRHVGPVAKGAQAASGHGGDTRHEASAPTMGGRGTSNDEQPATADVQQAAGHRSTHRGHHRQGGPEARHHGLRGCAQEPRSCGVPQFMVSVFSPPNVSKCLPPAVRSHLTRGQDGPTRAQHWVVHDPCGTPAGYTYRARPGDSKDDRDRPTRAQHWAGNDPQGTPAGFIFGASSGGSALPLPLPFPLPSALALPTAFPALKSGLPISRPLSRLSATLHPSRVPFPRPTGVYHGPPSPRYPVPRTPFPFTGHPEIIPGPLL